MSRNPHIANAEYVDRAPEIRVVDATLALAYEQRTANLLALYAMSEGNTEAMAAQANMAPEDWEIVARQITERLGL